MPQREKPLKVEGIKIDVMENNPLSQIFNERKLEIESSKNRWFRWFIANIALLFLIAVLIFIGLTIGTGFAVASWLEFGVALPLAYSAVFFHAQHAKAREYLEEYSFKVVVARSLGAYRDLLKGDINSKNPDEQKKYLDFMIGSVKDLFTPPREIISKHPIKDEEDVKVGVVEKLGDVFKKFVPKL